MLLLLMRAMMSVFLILTRADSSRSVVMVVKINAPTPHCSISVKYNESKVEAGEASVLFTMNIPDPENPLATFEAYERGSLRCEKMSFHASIDPSNDDRMTDKDIEAFAKKLMERLGYGEQPYIVYKHSDIDRVHYHIVSVRVDKEGKKINDSNEKKRCHQILKELAAEFGYKVGNDQKRDNRVDEFGVYKGFNPKSGNYSMQFEKLTAHAMRYHFTTEPQFRMLMNSLNVDFDYRKRGGKEWMVFYGLNPKSKRRCTSGISGKKLDVPSVEQIRRRSEECKGNSLKKERGRVASVVRSLLPHSQSEEHFRRMLEKTGITVCFSKSDDGRIFGATFIDHTAKCCFKASELPNIKAGMFEQMRLTHWPEDEREKADAFSTFEKIADVTDLAMKLLSEENDKKGEDEEMMRRGRRKR